MSFETIISGIFSSLFLASIIRISTPLIFASAGGLITELTGVANIAMEGIMLASAFTGVLISHFTGSALVGMLAGMLIGVLVGLLLGFFHITFKTNPILAGIAINVMCAGATVFLLAIFTGEKGNSSSLASKVLPNIEIPILKSIPFLNKVLSGHNVLTYISFLSVLFVYFFMYKTKLGRHMRAVGENAQSAASVGINVSGMKYISCALSGLVVSLGGINLSMGYLSVFQRDMTAGRGFIAVAAIFLGRKQPRGVLIASLFFGFADALANQIGSSGFPPQWIQMIPYVATVLALVVGNLVQNKNLLVNR